MELIGDGMMSVDVEVIVLVVGVLKNVGLVFFKIVIGYVGIVDVLFVEVFGNVE